MKFIQKILFIVIVGTFCWNTERMNRGRHQQRQSQTVLDLPANTPGLQNNGNVVQYKGVRCIHIKIDNNNIYFPSDGHQPTTEEVAEYSCANIDNNKNSPITKWYMKMFGYREKTKAGIAFWIKKGRYTDVYGLLESDPNHILEHMRYYKRNVVIIRTASEESEAEAFWRTFRILAANPVGRVLLYRILVEIRRYKEEESYGVCEFEDLSLDTLTLRNYNRSILIKSNGYNFSPTNRQICFDNQDVDLPELQVERGRIKTIMKKTSKDVCLFHEMLHWYQLLRNPYRYNEEYHATLDTEQNESISNPYYSNDPIFTWGKGIMNIPDIRVILGIPNLGNEDLREYAVSENDLTPMSYLIGDELSENVYRLSLIYNRSRTNGNIFNSIRWGHSDILFNADLKDASINKFILAYRVAIQCFDDITSCGKSLKNMLKYYRLLMRERSWRK